jgi:hypothetical protein
MEADMKKAIIAAVSLMALSFAAYAGKDVTENKNVTLVSAQSSVDGKSDINEKLLEECIVSLPGVNDLEAQVTSHAGYVKEINGDPNKNDFAKSYSAVIEINYMVHQQSLVIVTTSSIQGQEPVMKVFEKNLKETKRFESDPTEGETYAGRSNRVYYFPTADAAIADVKKRAAIWLKQQAAVVCSAQNKAAGAKKNQ